MAGIVEGLFGMSPAMADQQLMTNLDAQAYQHAQLDPLQRAAMGMYKAGGMLAGGIATAFGLENPQVAEAKMREQAMAGLDPSNPQSILERAAQIQNPRLKFGLVDLANNVEERQIKRGEYQARIAEAQRKAASAAQKEAFVKQVLSDPAVSEDVKNYIRMGGDISKFIDPQTIAPGAVFGMPNFKGGFTELAKGAAKEEATSPEAKFVRDALTARGLKPGTPEWQSESTKMFDKLADKKTNIHVSTAGGSEDFTPDMADAAIDMALVGDNSMMIGWGRSPKAKVKLMARLSERMKSGELTPREFAEAKISMTGAQASERTVASQGANIQLSANEANQMMDVVRSTIPAVNLTEYPSLNKLKNAVDKGLGGPAVPRLFASLNALVNTYARAINPRGVATVRDKEHATQMINEAMSAGQLEGVMQIMKSEMDAALAAPQLVRQNLAAERRGGTGVHSTVPVRPVDAIPTNTPTARPTSRASQFTVERD